MDLILACHIKNNDWYKLINYNLSKIINYCNNIYIVYSISNNNINSKFFEENITYKNINFIKVENKGKDFKKYKTGLLSLNINSKYDWNAYLNRYADLKEAFGDDVNLAKKHWFEFGKNEGRNCWSDINKSVILMNDSFIFSRNIDDIMCNIQKKIKDDVKFIGLCKSNINREHYQSYFWILNYELVSNLCDLLTNDKFDDSKGSNNVIIKCEIEISNLLIKKYKSDFIYNTNSDNFILDKLVHLLSNGFPIIKLQCLKKTQYNLNVNITDFNPTIYKDLHSDLKHLSNDELKHHFFNNGISEGRKYKYNQKSFIPQSIEILLNKTGLQYQNFI